jgi:hypothetical protein
MRSQEQHEHREQEEQISPRAPLHRMDRSAGAFAGDLRQPQHQQREPRQGGEHEEAVASEKQRQQHRVDADPDMHRLALGLRREPPCHPQLPDRVGHAEQREHRQNGDDDLKHHPRTSSITRSE